MFDRRRSAQHFIYGYQPRHRLSDAVDGVTIESDRTYAEQLACRSPVPVPIRYGDAAIIRRHIIHAPRIGLPLHLQRSLECPSRAVRNIRTDVEAAGARNVTTIETPVSGRRILRPAVIFRSGERRLRRMSELVLAQPDVARDAPGGGGCVFQAQRRSPFAVTAEVIARIGEVDTRAVEVPVRDRHPAE